MPRLCSSVLLSLVIASAGHAIPLALSATDATWTFETIGGIRSTLTLHLDDLAYPAPGIGLLQITITGHVKQPGYRHHQLQLLGMEIYGDHGGSAVRAALISTEFSDPSLGATASTFSPGLTGYGDPITYAWIDYGTGVSARQLDWTSTALLYVDGVGDQPKSVDFYQHQLAEVGTCIRRSRCVDHCIITRDCGNAPHFGVQVMAIPEPSSAAYGFRIAMIPEPSTGLLVMVGLLGFGGGRRRRA